MTGADVGVGVRAARHQKVDRQDVGVRHRRDLAHLGDAAGMHDVRLQHPAGTLLDDLAELPPGQQPLPDREGDADLPLHRRHHPGVLERHRLLQPARLMGAKALRHPGQGAWGEVLAALDEDVDVGSHRLPRRPNVTGYLRLRLAVLEGTLMSNLATNLDRPWHPSGRLCNGVGVIAEERGFSPMVD